MSAVLPELESTSTTNWKQKCALQCSKMVTANSTMLKKQLLFVFATILTSACSSWGAPLDCDSNVRIILPQLFTHCSSCSYSEWSKWQFVSDSIVDVPRSQCDSGQSYSESRSRSAIGDGCYPETETRVICKCCGIAI